MGSIAQQATVFGVQDWLLEKRVCNVGGASWVAWQQHIGRDITRFGFDMNWHDKSLR